VPTAPDAYVKWINQHIGFNPRGQRQSDFLTQCILEDLRTNCAPLRMHLERGELKLRRNVGLSGRRNLLLSRPHEIAGDDDAEVDPNIDVVLRRTEASAGRGASSVPLTLENKTIMTAHGKARTNRYNDARAYASRVHANDRATIAAFAIVINAALSYRNPDALARSARVSGANRARDAAATIALFESMRLRNAPEDAQNRCEAVWILVLEYDAVNPTVRLVHAPPAPPPSSEFGYAGFLDRLCRLYQEPFG